MSGVLHGLFRVRYFTQDDAHIYCTPEQLEDEVLGVVRFMKHIYAAFGFSRRQDRAEHAAGEEHRLGRGLGAGRGRRSPTRARGRQGIDLQAQPRRRRLLRAQDRLPHPRRHGPHLAVRHHPGGLRHAGAPGHHLHGGRQRRAPARHDPPRAARQHRALHGHPARALRRQPADVARAGAGPRAADRRPPRRVRRRGVRAARRRRGRPRAGAVTLHVDIDDRGESVGKRIRDAQLQKVPYILVVGDREVESGTVGVRERGEDTGARPLGEFVDSWSPKYASGVCPEAEPSCGSAVSPTSRSASVRDRRALRRRRLSSDDELPTRRTSSPPHRRRRGSRRDSQCVTVRWEPTPAEEWLAEQLRRARDLLLRSGRRRRT